MSIQYELVLCTLCNREFKRYDKRDLSKIFGINLNRSKNYNLILEFTHVEKSTMNKHICTQCIDDIVNEFAEI